ncbi:hypothetical protein CLV62_12584 [Dysgonomonas alginatilytica]|uniref:Uncharacterized protein n=1 Tax=Dysgonomonas alginatilytica TaxID=1605892 RepID=A0A2V3PL31_9BACT|nr:hypothetical protein CLV62_12584 [Dysgonomonas alginatilytica]
MSIAVHKELIIGYNKSPEVLYHLFAASGSINDITEKEARFLYESLGKFLEIKDDAEK